MSNKNDFRINRRFEEADFSALTEEERAQIIRYYEAKRLAVIAEMEDVANAFAKETGDRSLTRGTRLGDAPNDFRK